MITNCFAGQRKFGFALGLVAAALLAGLPTVEAAIVNNGGAIGANYTIAGIDVAGSVDFTAHAAVPGDDATMGQNSNTIGKITLTLNHAGLVWLGFTLTQNLAAVPLVDGGATGGLRLLFDVVDTNGMIVPWVDYHIRAVDANNIAGGAGHLKVAHFHDVNSGFGSGPLVIQGVSDNVVQLNFGLGAAVAPGNDFTASNILLHERDIANVQRSFRVETIPSIVPIPGAVWLFGSGLLALVGFAKRRRRV